MASVKNQIILTPSERNMLQKYSASGVHSAKSIRRAKVILALDSSGGRKPFTLQRTADAFDITIQAVHNIKKDFLALGADRFLQRKKRDIPPVPVKVDGDLEAHLIALCCSDPPEGYARWSVRLLADKCVELNYVESISHMTVSRALKKTNLSLT